jgi:hypothetical protein
MLFIFRLQDIEVGKQKHLHVYQADQLNFRQGVGVCNLHPLGGLHIGGVYEMKSLRKFMFFKITPSFLVRIWSSRYQIKDILKIYNLK